MIGREKKKREKKDSFVCFFRRLFFVEVMMGDGNLVECAVIKATKEARPVVIGSGNVFEDKCVLENCQVGDYCVIGQGAKLVDCTLIAGNVVAPKVELKVKRNFFSLMRVYKTNTGRSFGCK